MAIAEVLSPQELRLVAEKAEQKSGGFLRERTSKIYRSFAFSKPRIDIERAKYFTESFKATEGQPLVLRWAKALYHIAGNIPVYIDDCQLLAGRVGCPGKHGLIYPELDGCFLDKISENVKNRKNTPFDLTDEDAKIIDSEIAPYWKGKSFYDELAYSFPEDVLKVTYNPENIYEARFIVNETASMRSALQWVHDYEKPIAKGFKAIKEDAEKELAALDPMEPTDMVDKAPFLQAVIIVSDAIILWAKRHAQLAREMAAKETDSIRRGELQTIAEICSRVPEYPARNFREALQCQWFTQSFSRLEQKTGATISNGRMDQYLYPYYKKDLDAGLIDEEQAKELLECMWLGMAQYLDLYISPAGANLYSGSAHWEAVTIGGVDEKGDDATNELTYVFLHSKRGFPFNYPDLAARVHSLSPERYLYEVAETVKDGSGFPKLINDEEVIPFLLAKGADIAQANTYAVSGCTESRMPNLDTFTTPCPYVNLGAALELTLNNGRMKTYGDELLTIETGELKDFKTWEDFWQAYLAQQEYLLKQAFKQLYIIIKLREKHFASPFGSSLHELCLKNHKDLHSAYIDGGVEIGYFDFIGYGTVVDSLCAIKETVFDRQKLSLEKLCEVLDKNFEGYEDIRQMLMKSPKYGNNDSVADSIAKDIDLEGLKFAHKYSKKMGFHINLRYVPVTSHIPFGKIVHATPNGRKAGMYLSDGSSAAHGADVKGPTAVLMSNYNSKNRGYHERASRLLNIKLTPACVAGDEGTHNLMSFIRGWCDLKLWHVQFNIINQSTLLAAKKNPEQYRDLLVRVAGYSAYFVDLSPELQDDIIARTAHSVI
ncbi:pyruvate formate lyase family protein [Desulfoscipio sp. XC116]|uniref:(2S)-3-sulfopropanediol dehydratase n=1 Tax=Desulfoscipio sp. XC116 TaxID=3144975 RepID=UPI00325A7391